MHKSYEPAALVNHQSYSSTVLEIETPTVKFTIPISVGCTPNSADYNPQSVGYNPTSVFYDPNNVGYNPNSVG